MHARLYPVGPELAANYNRALEASVGRRTSLQEFHIDKRGESPEIEEELGWNYLQRSRSDRYLIIVSPEQRNADLLHEEFSFDEEILDFLYRQYLTGIELITRVDGVWAELDDGLRIIESIEDLLLLGHIKLDLRTPSGFLRKARTLQAMVRALRRDPALLIRQDSAHIHRMLEMVKQVGDVRDYNLGELSLTREIGSYHTRLYGGTWVFREGPDPLALQRPNGERPETSERDPVLRTVVVYDPKNGRLTDTPGVRYLPLSAPSRIVDWLLKSERAVFDPHLLDLRLYQMEEEALAEAGVQPRGESARRQALTGVRDRLPGEWKRLLDIQRQVQQGYAFHSQVLRAPIEVKTMLLAGVAREGRKPRETESLLCRLWPWDYLRTWRYSPHDLERIFSEAPPWRQDLILRVLNQAGTPMPAGIT